jgi:ribosomal protein L37AE/L43A
MNMNLEMITCPKCGNDFPLKRKELGYHVCVNCSTVEPVVGITTVEGTGDHTYNDIIIMDQSRARAIAEKEAELTGKKVHIEMLDFDKDEFAVSQSIKEEIHKALDEDL